LENECLNHHHTCDPTSQSCYDLEDGYECRCKSGYKLVGSVCKPICNMGCLNGVCVAPNRCQCHFGYIGDDCSLKCNCNGHSSCPSRHLLNVCTQCFNNTQGSDCSQCKPFYVGDPRNS